MGFSFRKCVCFFRIFFFIFNCVCDNFIISLRSEYVKVKIGIWIGRLTININYKLIKIKYERV